MTAKIIKFPISEKRQQKALELYNKASLIDTDLNQLNNAILLYEESIKYNPNFDSAYNNLGNCYLNKCQYYEAEINYDISLKLNPQQPETNYNKGYLLLQYNKIEESEWYFFQAIKYDQNFADAYYNLGIIFNLKNDKNQAINFYKKYIILADPENNFIESAKKYIKDNSFKVMSK